MEIWKDIEGFPGYQISDQGSIKSYINNRHGIGKKSHFLKPTITKRGYCVVQLGRGNRRQVHRLVAKAFIPNPDGLPLVRHLDDNPSNNSVTNLAWGTQTDNMRDCVKHDRLVGDTRAAIESIKKPVKAYSIDGNFMKTYDSVHSAARELNVWPQHICNVIKGKINQTGGYKFEYIRKEEE